MPDAAGAIPLSRLDLVIAAALVLIAGLISVLLRLKLERQLALASIRTIVQLLLIGHILRWVFAIESGLAVTGVLAVMILTAGRAAIGRSSRSYSGAFGAAFVSLSLTGILITFTVTGIIVGTDPWWEPQYAIPLMGMVLGNGLTGISLCLDQLLESLAERREVVEMELSLGASRWEAARDSLAEAVRRGMIPIVNAMMVVGLVSLPGMMTGQILAGADPLDAVKYQIVVMFMLAAGTAIGAIVMALLVYRRLFNEKHQLEADRIRKKGKG